VHRTVLLAPRAEQRSCRQWFVHAPSGQSHPGEDRTSAFADVGRDGMRAKSGGWRLGACRSARIGMPVALLRV
jgi:hypothetical protein